MASAEERGRGEGGILQLGRALYMGQNYEQVVSFATGPAWIPPPAGVVKVNVDAAVARTAAGEYLGSSSVIITGISDPETLEALAVREGLDLALDLSVPRVKLASDCLSVVKAMKEQNLGRYSHILHDITASSVAFAEFGLVHESRVSNNEPHVLARFVLGSPVGRYVWLGNPPVGVCIPHLLN
jgi:hypothetical protein